MDNFTVSLVATLLILTAYFVYTRPRGSVSYLRGPVKPSFMLGHMHELRNDVEVGELEFSWAREYGPTFQIGGCFGTDVVFLADPKGLQYVMQTAAYHFRKPSDVIETTSLLLGRGILSVEGQTHQRHRKVMNPAFTAQQLRTFLPLFQRSASRLTQKWKNEIHDGSREFNVVRWLARLTLDALGDAAFDYRFGALDNASNELAKSFSTLVTDTGVRMSKAAILFRSLLKHLPSPFLKLLMILPTPSFRRFSQFRILSQNIASGLIRDKASVVSIDSTSRDVLSILARSNQAEDEKKRLDEDEVLSQMATLMLAGHETTAQTLTWLLYELAKNPDDQRKIRDEIQSLRARCENGEDFTITDLDSLLYTTACVKEVLRVHPIVPTLSRVAGRDEVIPLQTAVTSTTGEPINEVIVKKGQEIFIGISVYNRLPTVWGDDADQWRPSRFLEGREKQASVGVFANL
ncbi:hypothetical protein HGRIS_004215 [Hohenbuehelia grisea]|uniref:Cytochrome P450 n=2 Tax=Hohenbuehelia grisea TaxID=104357 RepID=A0ABR3JI22_9AGAR